MTNPQAAPSLDAAASSGPSTDARAAFGRDLKAIKEAAGWTTEQAAERARITRKTWGRIEAGQPVRGHSIRGVERAFDVPAGSFAKAYAGEMALAEAYRQATTTTQLDLQPDPRHSKDRKSEPNDQSSFGEWQLSELLKEFRKAVPHMSSTDLVQVSETVSATLTIRQKDAVERYQLLRIEYDHATQARHRAYSASARLEAELAAMKDRVGQLDEKDESLIAFRNGIMKLETELSRAWEEADAASAHADRLMFEIARTDQEIAYLNKASKDVAESKA